MKLKEFFWLSLNNLKRRKLRSWLTMIGIFIGIAAVVSLISLGNSLQNSITGQFESLGTDFLTIQNSGTGMGPPGSTVVKKLNEHDLKIIQQTKGVEDVIPRILRMGEINYNKKSNFYFIASFPEDDKQINEIYKAMDLKTKEGRLMNSKDSGKILIGSDIAEKKNFNKEIKIGKKIFVQGKKFEVIGILKKMSNFQLNKVGWVTEGDIKDLFKTKEEYDFFIVKIKDGENGKEVSERIKRRLRKDRNEKIGEEDFSVETPLKAISVVNDILSAVKIIVIGIALISILVGGIGIANTMYTSVLERKKEIGTMKAIGAKNSDILLIFVIESGLLGLIGGLIGIGLGFSIAKAISVLANNLYGGELLEIRISWILLSFSLIFSFLIGIISGFFPSNQASKLNPVEAIRG